MEKKVNIDINTLKFLYGKYKDFLVPLVVIIACFILLIKFVVPQFRALFTLGNEAKKAESQLSILKNNFSLLSGLGDSTLDSQLQIVNFALPTNKDFIGIINAISSASSASGVNVGEFQLQIGDLLQTPTNTSAFSLISLNLSVTGGIDDVNKFMTVLSNALPLSEVTSINIGNALSTVAINFYYRPLPPVNYNDATPINPIPDSKLTIINKLSGFNYNPSGGFESVGSPSDNNLTNPL